VVLEVDIAVKVIVILT